MCTPVKQLGELTQRRYRARITIHNRLAFKFDEIIECCCQVE